MVDIEQRLRAAMRAAVDAGEPAPEALIAAVMRRLRRRSMLLACLAVLVAVAVAIPAVIVARVVASPAPATQHGKQLPTGLRGLPLPAHTNLQLLITTAHNKVVWYSTASNTEAPITGLSALASAGYVLFGRVQGGTWASQGCVHYRCYAPHEYYFIADGSHTATPIGAGIANEGLVASSSSGAVWLVSYPHYWDKPATTSATARLVSTSGQALGQQYLLPAGYFLQASIGRHLLLQKIPFDTHTFVLWDPSARRVVRNIDNAIAASQDRIAWTQGCRGCHVQILNASTLKSLSTPLPAGTRPRWGTGSFSDDGQLLAYTAPGGSADVFSVRTGVLLLEIPAVGANEWFVAGWLNGGPTLMVAAGWASGRHHAPPRPPTQVGIWQPGDTALRMATVKNTAEIHAFVQWVDYYELTQP